MRELPENMAVKYEVNLRILVLLSKHHLPRQNPDPFQSRFRDFRVLSQHRLRTGPLRKRHLPLQTKETVEVSIC